VVFSQLADRFEGPNTEISLYFRCYLGILQRDEFARDCSLSQSTLVLLVPVANETVYPSMLLYGYARVSSLDQDLSLQHSA
jgi:hypothetical protein